MLHTLLARCLDMEHNLIQDARQIEGTVFGLVTQRIVTTQTSTIKQSDQQANTLLGKIGHQITKVGGIHGGGGAKCYSDFHW